jgi:two-component system sensor kinase FixL
VLSSESRALLDAAVDGVVLITHEGTVQAFNAAATRLFGYTPEEILGRNVTTLMSPADATVLEHQHHAHLLRYFHTGENPVPGIGREVIARRKDGSLVPVYLSVGRIEGEEPRRYVGFIQDLTLRREAIAALEEKRERTEQDRSRMLHVARLATLGEMASGIAHELNQPLAAIANFSQACSRLLAQPEHDVQEIREALEQISAQSLRAGKIIHHLRRLVSTRDSQRELTDVNELIQETETLTRADARSANVRTQLQLAPDLPRLMLDRVQIQQVLLNLLRNAVEALTAVTTSREIVLRSALNADADVTVTVSDNGRGVSLPMLQHLFAPFTTDKEQGTGLGLSMSRTILEAHRGRLEYEANTPRGARFTLTLPH